MQPAAVVPTAATCLFPAELLQLHAAQVVDLLCISDAEATRALRYYKWDVSKLQVIGFYCNALEEVRPTGWPDQEAPA